MNLVPNLDKPNRILKFNAPPWLVSVTHQPRSGLLTNRLLTDPNYIYFSLMEECRKRN